MTGCGPQRATVDVMDLESLAVVLVLYRSENVIAECVRILPSGVELVLVNNDSPDHATEVARAIRPDATCVSSKTNRGFGGGCNLGVKATTRPVIMFLNPDARVTRPAIGRLLERLQSLPHSVVGPAMLSPNGSRVLFRRSDSPLRDFAWELPAASRWLPAAWRPKVGRRDTRYEKGGEVPFVDGACFVVRRTDIEAVGGFDEDFFLYGEEISLAQRLRALGGTAYYEPSAEAWHIGGTSAREAGTSTNYHIWRSRALMRRKCHCGVRLRYRLAMDVCALAAGGAAALLRERHGRGPVATWWSGLCGFRNGLIGDCKLNHLYADSVPRPGST